MALGELQIRGSENELEVLSPNNEKPTQETIDSTIQICVFGIVSEDVEDISNGKDR